MQKMSLREQFNFFIDRADQLASTSLVQNGGLNTSITAKFDQVSGLTYSSTEPNEDELRSALSLVRQFVLKKEPININRIYNLCELNIQSEEIKTNLREARQHWIASCRETWLKMTHDGNAVTPTYIADLWFNGHYFHASKEEDEALRRLVDEGDLFQRHVFLGYVSDLIGQILYLRRVIKHALSEGLLVAEPEGAAP